MSTLLAVDPSLSCTGWAVFEGGELRRCGVVPTKSGPSIAARLWAIVRQVPRPTPAVLVIEFPQIYRTSHGKGEDPNDQLKVAAVAGAILAAHPWPEARTPTPAEWKGQTPKHVHNQRVINRLSSTEIDVFNRELLPESQAHNAIDAIGLGLWVLGRMEVRRHGTDPAPVTAPRHRRRAG